MIDLEHVSFSYDGETIVLDGISLRIEQGEFLCVLGGNGSGKSTLAKHLNALFIPDEGRVTVDGHDTADPSYTYLIRSTVGMVFQNPDDQLVASLIENDVAFGPENLGVPTEQLRQRVTDSLAEVGLMGFERKETTALSGGQKQRVAIAGVLAMEPRVLVLDEASSMLDPRGRKGLMRVCQELHEAGMTIVMITHFMEEATLADRVVVLKDGRVCMEGTPQDVLVRADELEGLNLEAPFACEVSSDLRKRGLPVRTEVDEDVLAQAIVDALDTDAFPALDATDDRMAAHETTGGRRLADQAADGTEPATGTAQALKSSPEREDAPAYAASPTSFAAFDVDADTCAPAEGSTAQPLIQFENVSFAYLSAAERRKMKKRARRAGTGPDASAAMGMPAWGNSPDNLWALHDLSFTVHEGDFLGIAGHTGSGKSTLLQLMNGLLEPTHGRVLVEGTDTADKRAATALRGHVGLVFQYPEHQLFAATVYEDVAFGPRNLGLPSDEVDARVRSSLAQVGLSFNELHDKSPFELSGGQQRRVAFAGVLAMSPRTLILDEPVAGLDPRARAEFLELIRGLHEDGLTVVMVSHDMDDLANLCSRLLVLKEGELFASGTPQAVFLQGSALKNVGLGLPAPQRFALALRDAGVPLRPDVLYDRATLVDALAALPWKEVARP